MTHARRVVKRAKAIFLDRARHAEDRNDAVVRTTRDVRSVKKKRRRKTDNKRSDTREMKRWDKSCTQCVYVYIYTRIRTRVVHS